VERKVHPESSVQVSQQSSILLTKVGSAPYLFGVVDEIRNLLPSIRLLGIESTEDSVGHLFDEAVARTDQLLLGSYVKVPEECRFLPPQVFRKFEQDIGLLLRLADRVFAHDLGDLTNDLGCNKKPEDSFGFRMQLVMRHAVYWNFVLTTRNVKAVVFPNLPHGMWDAVLLSLAKARDVPYMFFHEVPPFRGTLYLYNDSERIGNFEFGRRTLAAAEKRYGLINSSDAREYVLLDQARMMPSKYDSGVLEVQRSKFDQLTKLMTGKRPVSSVFHSIRRRQLAATALRAEHSVYSMKNLNDGFYFLELQLPGNATTLVKGREYPNQIDIIRFVASSLPSASELVIRESPRFHERRLARPSGFWPEISRIPKVRVVGANLSLDEISRRAAVVVELSYSSLALKHLLSGKPVVFLSNTHLGRMPNMFRLEDFSSLSNALRSAGESAVVEDDQVILREVGRHVGDLLEATIETALSWYPKPVLRDPEYGDRLTRNVARVIATWFLSMRFDESLTTNEKAQVHGQLGDN